jgi:hypothetical protein
MDYLASLLVFLCASIDRIPPIISMTFPIGSLCFSYYCLCCIGILAMEKRFDSLSTFLYLVFWQWKNELISCLHFVLVSWNGKTFLFVIPVYVVLVFWQWKNDLIHCLHFYIWYPGNGKTFFVLFMSTLYWYPGNGKTKSFPYLRFYNWYLGKGRAFWSFLYALAFGIRAMKKGNHDFVI